MEVLAGAAIRLPGPTSLSLTVLRAYFDRLSPGQRAVLIGLIVLVAGAAVAVALLAAGGSAPATTTTTTPVPVTTEPQVPDTTTAPTTSPPETTSSTADTTTTTTADVETVEEILTLRPDGLGEFLFGGDAEDTFRGLALLLGNPDDDTGWVDQPSVYGTCLGETVRFVRWHSLQVFMTDGASDWGPAGKRHFAAYVNSGAFEDDSDPLALVTAEDAGIGTTVGDLRSLYGDLLTVEDDPFLGDFFRVDFPGAGFLIGAVTGISPADLVESVAAGVSCGE